MQTIVWRDGKTRITTDNFYLEMSNRVQVRFTQEDPDENSAILAGTAAKGDPRGSFRIRRAKFKFEGWFIKSWLTYEVQLNYPGVTGSNIGALLEDAAFDVDFSKGKGLFRLHVGQFKAPFGAQEMTSSGSQQFVDRALVSNSFFRGRETGVALWGATAEQQARVARRHVQRQQHDPHRERQQQVPVQRAHLVAAQRQPGAEPARVGDRRALLRERLRVDHRADLRDRGQLGKPEQLPDDDRATTCKWNAYSIDGIFKYQGLRR